MINNTLHNHVNLKHDLMAIFNHRDARWSPGDFDSFGVPNEKQSEQSPGPSFLQPPHQPTISLPPVFSLGSNIVQSNSSLHPFGLGRPSHHHPFHSEAEHTRGCRLRGLYESHEVQDTDQRLLLSPFHVPEHAKHPALDKFVPGLATGYNTNGLKVERSFSVDRSQPDAFNISQHPSNHGTGGNPDTVMEWNDGCMSMFNGTRTSAQEHTPDWPSPALEEFHPKRHDSMAVGEIAMSSRVSMGFLSGLAEVPNDPTSHRAGVSPEPAVGISGEVSTTAGVNAVPARKDPAAPHGAFIHALCGKAFSSRSKVKKHHWGNMLNDLETTTGCWAKHNKPNVNWDDDPSCKAVPSKVSSNKLKSVGGTSHQKIQKSHSMEQKAPLAPAMVPQPNIVDPRDSVQPRTPARVPSPHVLFHAGEYGDGNILPYHSHRLPSSGSMDNLLTVVNSEMFTIEAPKPQDRNDSIVANLNAQASATAWDGLVHHTESWTVPPHTPTPISASNDCSYTTFPDYPNSNIDVQESFFTLSSPQWTAPRSQLAANSSVFQHDSTLLTPRTFAHITATSHSGEGYAQPMRGLSISPEPSPRRKKRRIGDGEGTEEVIVAQENEMTGVHFR